MVFWSLNLSGGLQQAILFVYPLIWHTVFDVRTQLSLAGDKLWLININLYISEYVIDEVGQSIGCFSSHHSDAADKRSVHGALNEAEDVLNAASILGLDAIVLLLLVSQRIVTMSFLTNDRIHPTSSYDIIL